MTSPASQSARSGSWIPWIFVAFFGVVVLVNGIMIWVATTTWTGLDTHEAYEKGLAYNQMLEAAEAQASLGWTIDIEISPIDNGQASIAITLTGSDGDGINEAKVRAQFEKPNRSSADFETELQPRGNGQYETRFEPPEAGVWNLHLTARRNDDLFVEDRRLVLR